MRSRLRYPDLIRTDTPLHDGYFRLGGVFRVEAATLRRVRPHLEQMFAARKNNFQMAQLIGIPFIVRYLFRRLTVDQIVARASEILQCRGAAVRHVPPELAFDIDLPKNSPTPANTADNQDCFKTVRLKRDIMAN